jgi:hypothetical protein
MVEIDMADLVGVDGERRMDGGQKCRRLKKLRPHN